MLIILECLEMKIRVTVRNDSHSFCFLRVMGTHRYLWQPMGVYAGSYLLIYSIYNILII